MTSNLAFCTLGMFIIDEIDYINGKGSETSIIGGAGTYAALGARLAVGIKNARRVGWIVDQGSDFPPEFRTIIETWQTSCLFNLDLTRLTTRAWNGYGPNEYRSFKYLTPKLRLEEHSLNDEQILAASFHMVCSPKRCITLVESIRQRRSLLQPGFPPAIFIWEPVPDMCTPEELENLQDAAQYVDVVSPNGDELAQFFSETSGQTNRTNMVEALLAKTGGHNGQVSVVIRDGADGSRLYLEHKTLHIRAYHQGGIGVVDPTGGGNTYLGALAMGMTCAVDPDESYLDNRLFSSSTQKLIRTPNFRRHLSAVIHATIAASYAIEQVGTPSLADNEPDCWNEQVYGKRFAEYLERQHQYLLDQIDDRNSG